MADPNPWSGQLRWVATYLNRIQREAHERGQSEVGVLIEQAVGDINLAAETEMTDPFKGILS